MSSVSQLEVAAANSTSRAERPVRKVFYLVDSLNVGGTESQAVELARRIAATNYKVTLGCLRAQGLLRERLTGSQVELQEFHPRGGLDSPSGVYQLLRLANFLRAEKFDVVHTHDLWSNLMGVPAARLAGVPAIVSSRRGDLPHVVWYHGSRRQWLRRIQNLSGAVVANSTQVRDVLLSEDGFLPAKLRVIVNGVDVERFQRKGDRARLFPNIDGRLVVLVGNMHSDVKGHPGLIAAAPAILSNFPDTHFVLVGEGTERPRFEQQVSDLGLTSRFVFLGRRQDIPEILASCEIAVLPSQSEGMPNAILEYMAAGLPVVATGVGGNQALIEDRVTGRLVPPENSAALAEALSEMLREPEAAQRMAQNARKMVAQKFGFERLVREVDELYTDLLSRRKATTQ